MAVAVAAAAPTSAARQLEFGRLWDASDLAARRGVCGLFVCFARKSFFCSIFKNHCGSWQLVVKRWRPGRLLLIHLFGEAECADRFNITKIFNKTDFE